MSFIDLGEITDEPVRDPPRRPLDLRRVRRAVPAALLAALTYGNDGYLACVDSVGGLRVWTYGVH
ncbi:hypothetical protein Lfu02_30360 [Longispora fulva]|uniref:Uncharacterized protein n=1 Tax=Longispora fulva TaxID=619741 RepID=A0A8J7KYC5_9ACTN|nr:hypothetical protein [Longispora fulva]MBG6139172.1 hypothetical protein [Longispora fulva]GIG58664.1 hypothetical protein Lfu02_30360 [Longispora fulva]